MKKIIEKTIAILLVIFMCLNIIFPKCIYAYSKEEIHQQLANEIDYKINLEIKRLSDEGILTVENVQNYIDGMSESIVEYETYNSIKNDPNFTDADIQMLMYYIQDYLDNAYYNAVTYIQNYSPEESVPEPPEVLPEINAPETWADFESQIRIWVEEKLSNYNTNEEKKAYLEQFQNNWRIELKDTLNPEKLDPIECDDIVEKVVSEKLEAFEINVVTNISLEQARLLLIARLGELKTQKELELEDTDEDTKLLRLQEYFQDIKDKHVQATGDFYLETIEIANKIKPESDRETFLSNVPSYIEQFINDSLGTNIASSDVLFNLFNLVIDAVALKFLYIPKVLFIIVPGAVIQTVETMLGSIGNENGSFKLLTIDNIFFNKIPLTDINIFDFKTAGDSDISAGNVLLNIRNNVASWYYAIRNLSIAIGLAVLIYIGIRMAISSIADDKAKYKKMFKDWLVSFALIFVLQYLMIFILQLNDGIIDVLAKTKDAEELKIGLNIYAGLEIHAGETLQDKLLIEAFSPSLMRGMASSILYFLLVVMTLLFLIVYIKRFITICILTMISPLITITYAIDKAGDGKAQALNKWLGEFVFTVLIQPFHCIIYMVFLQNIFSIINDTSGILQFGKIFVAIIMLGFIYKAEDIVKGIFGFKANNLSSAAILGGMAISKAASIGKLKSNMSGIKGAGQKASDIKNIQTPNSLPSQARNVNSTSSTPRASAQGSANSNNASTNKNSKLKNAIKPISGLGNTKADQLARKVAGKVISGAIGYGLTGEYAGAIASDKAIGIIGKKKDELVLSSRVKQRKEEALDAYQDYKESHGLTSEEMLEKSQELLNADIDSIEDAQDRNLAGWLQADKAAQEILGVDDANKEVMNHLKEYEG